MATLDAALILDEQVTVTIDGKTSMIDISHPNFQKVREALKNKDIDAIPALIDLPKVVNNFGEGKVIVENGVITYNGEVLHNSLTSRILKMIEEGFNVDPLIKFLENLMENPSHRAINELYSFLEDASLPITDDGHFLAYKKVRDDYKDIWSGKFDNSPGGYCRNGAQPSR